MVNSKHTVLRRQWRWLSVLAFLLPLRLMAAGGTSPAAIDQEWRDRFIMGVTASSFRNTTKAWHQAVKDLESARARGDQRAELRAAAAYFFSMPAYRADDCALFQRVRSIAQAAGAAFARETFDLAVATAGTWVDRPCAGQFSVAQVEAMARELGDPARQFYVLEAQVVDAMVSGRNLEVTSLRAKQLDYAIAPFQRAFVLTFIGDADLGADRKGTEAERWFDRARQEIDLDEFAGISVYIDANQAIIDFRRNNPAAAMPAVKRALSRFRQGVTYAQSAAITLVSIAGYLNKFNRPQEAIELLEESRKMGAEDAYTVANIATKFLTSYAQLRTPEAFSKGEREVRLVSAYLAEHDEHDLARMDAWAGIADFYEKFGRLEAALQARKQLEGAMEQVHRRAGETARIELQEKLNVALKDQENGQLKAEAALQEARQQGWIVAFSIAAAGVMATGVALAVAVRRGRRLAKVSVELAQRNSDLEQRSASRIRLLAAACHDLRQPAHALGMLAELGSEARQDTGRFTAWLQSVRRSTASLADMLDELMDLGRLDGGHYTPLLTEVPLGELLQEVMLHFGPLARRKGLTLEAPPVEAIAVSDRHLLRRILFNVVSNAIKYTDAGGVRIGVEVLGDEVRLSVQDSGPGIPQDKLDDVFRDYVRLNPLKAAEGLGIGLSIVRRAAELLGHDLALKSAPGDGTCVSLTLPLHRGTPVTGVEVDPAASGTRGVLAVMENDVDVRDAMAALLQGWGHTVIAAANADAVLARAGELKVVPDLIVTDLHLDHTDGLAEVTRLRERLTTPDLPALLITGDLDSTVTGQAALAQVYVAHKPLAPRKLAALVGQLLSAPLGMPAGAPA